MIKALIIYEVLMLITTLLSFVIYSMTGEELHLKIAQASFSGLVSPLLVLFLLLSTLLVIVCILSLPILLPIAIFLGEEDEL